MKNDLFFSGLDLLDGFFPAELQSDYPEGVIFLVDDRRFEIGNRVGLGTSPFFGIGRKLQSRPSSAAQTLFPPISKSPTISISSRPESSSSSIKNVKTFKSEPVKSKALTKDSTSAKKRQLQPASLSLNKESSELKKYAPFKRSSNKGAPSSSSISRDFCQLKIFGLSRDPFLLELVSYDTVKTLKGVISNLIRTQAKSNFPKKSENLNLSFKLFTAYPRRPIDDDSMTLGDLNLLPSGVIHIGHTTFS